MERASSPLLAGLNPAQRDAVEAIAGPVLILAGPGSGKTRVITHRIAYLMLEVGVQPYNILAVTFTNKAARSMMERLEVLVPGQVRHLTLGTFHAVCARILRREAAAIGISPRFSIYDDADQMGAVRSALKELDLDEKQHPPRAILSRISSAKSDLKSPHHFAEYTSSYWEEIVLRVYRRYQELLAQNNALDFDDLLMSTMRLFREQPDVLRRYQERYVHVLVDEFQDTNIAQYQIVKQLAGHHRNLCVVGDEDQCLLAGTQIAMDDGSTRAIETLEAGDQVRSAYGSGAFRAGRVVRIVSRNRAGVGIRITTRSGRTLTSTPEHVHFAGYVLGITPQTYFTYLIHRRGVGFRLGTTQVYTAGQVKPVPGFQQRLRQEHGDGLWIVATHPSENEARATEYIWSLKYQVPTLPFVPRKKASAAGPGVVGLAHDADYLARVFATIDTAAGAHRLLADLGLSPAQPHHRARSRNSSRLHVVVTLCGDRRGATPMHRISLVGNDTAARAALEALSLSVRPARSGSKSWRHETARQDFGEVMRTVDSISAALDVDVIHNARLGRSGPAREGNSLPLLAAGSIMPGMALFDGDGDYDVVVRVERVPLDRPVYDIDIANTHNFIANGLVTHNSIYSWRGANFKNVLNFESDFPGARVIYLEQNYRSTKTILDAARSVIAGNTMRKDKQLWTENEEGPPIRIFEAYNEEEEAGWVAAEIDRLNHQGLFNYRDFAVLYRTNAQSRALEKVFVRRRIPHKVVGTRFYERKEIKDVLAYLRACLNPDDSQTLQRIVNTPPRGIGQKTLTDLDRWARAQNLSWFQALRLLRSGDGSVLHGGNLPFSGRTERLLLDFLQLLERLIETSGRMDVLALIDEVVKVTGYADFVLDGSEEGEERIQNVRELATVALPYAESPPPTGLEAFIEETALVADVDGFDEESNAVSLITFHAAKGLEFPVVFLTGLEDGLTPHSRSFDSPEAMEEERRLAYVAITRARQRLYMVYAFRRSLFGGSTTNVPSRFLADIPNRLKQGQVARVQTGAPIVGGRVEVAPAGPTFDAPSTWGASSRRAAVANDVRFVPGDRVRHGKFGEGIVVKSELRNGDEEVDVAFAGVGVKKLALSFAPLERID